jgi:hypothetical protein
VFLQFDSGKSATFSRQIPFAVGLAFPLRSISTEAQRSGEISK